MLIWANVKDSSSASKYAVFAGLYVLYYSVTLCHQDLYRYNKPNEYAQDVLVKISDLKWGEIKIAPSQEATQYRFCSKHFSSNSQQQTASNLHHISCSRQQKTLVQNTYQYTIKEFMYKETKNTDYKTQQMQQ